LKPRGEEMRDGDKHEFPRHEAVEVEFHKGEVRLCTAEVEREGKGQFRQGKVELRSARVNFRKTTVDLRQGAVQLRQERSAVRTGALDEGIGLRQRR